MAVTGNLVSVIVRRVVWLAVLVAVAYGGLALYRHQQAAKAAAVPRYYAVPASMGPVTVSVSGAGTVQAVTTQSVTPLTAGRVSKVDVTLGQSVKAGDALYELQDTSGLTQQVEAAQASLDQAQTQLQSLTDPTASQDPRAVTQEQIKVQQAQLSLQQAQLNLSRDQDNAAQNAQATSLVDGTIQTVNVTSGQQVNAGAAIATVLPAGDPTVMVPVPEEDLLFLPVGTSAMVTVPALQTVVPGTVTARAATPSGQITLNAAGTPSTGGGSGGAGSTTQSLYPLTITLSQAIPDAPQNAAVLVSFTPQNSPPASYQWSDTGAITYPSPVTVTAQQAGVVGDLLVPGQTVKTGQAVATVTSSAAATTIQQDQIAVQQDQLNLQQAQLSLDQLEHPQPATAGQIAAQQATITSDQESLAQKQQQLGELTVRAPIDGTVVTLSASPGDNVSTSTAGVVLQAVAGVQAVAPIDELDIGKVKLGQPAQISVTAFPNTAYTGKVVAIAPSAVNQNGVSTYQVTVSLDKQANLLPGMSATVSIQVDTVPNALRVPAQAVTVIGGSRGIVRVMSNGRPQPTQVGVGLVSTDWTQITSGLQVGQPVVAGQISTSTGNPGALFRAGGLGGGFGPQAVRVGGPGGGGGRG